MRPYAALATAALLTVCVAGCSEDDPEPPAAATRDGSAAPTATATATVTSAEVTAEALCADLTPEVLGELTGREFSETRTGTGDLGVPYCDAFSDDSALLVHVDYQPPAASLEEVRDAFDPLGLPRTEVSVAGHDGLLTSGRKGGQTAANVFVEIDGRILFTYAKSAVGLGDPPPVDGLRTLALDVAESAAAALGGT
ncbi:hypothetical protein [Nocardioides flavescens]|uniref:DUF3558 domain-containing protein n=1 Tax=Nocardioides flavescens TaxID=2691959 RepID=A0A6L7ERE6_9ACTN|nr:hypothetical protein [Nocardioides flavescens]MXG90027.1 hypothetical protein [Nocardioides flavescens]